MGSFEYCEPHVALAKGTASNFEMIAELNTFETEHLKENDAGYLLSYNLGSPGEWNTVQATSLIDDKLDFLPWKQRYLWKQST